MGKSGGSVGAPTYQMPEYSAPIYKGPSAAEREARRNSLQEQYAKQYALDKQIEKFQVKREEVQDRKDDLDARKGVEEVLSNGQKGFIRQKPTLKQLKEIINSDDDDDTTFMGVI